MIPGGPSPPEPRPGHICISTVEIREFHGVSSFRGLVHIEDERWCDGARAHERQHGLVAPLSLGHLRRIWEVEVQL